MAKAKQDGLHRSICSKGKGHGIAVIPMEAMRNEVLSAEVEMITSSSVDILMEWQYGK